MKTLAAMFAAAIIVVFGLSACAHFNKAHCELADGVWKCTGEGRV